MINKKLVGLKKNVLEIHKNMKKIGSEKKTEIKNKLNKVHKFLKKKIFSKKKVSEKKKFNLKEKIKGIHKSVRKTGNEKKIKIKKKLAKIHNSIKSKLKKNVSKTKKSNSKKELRNQNKKLSVPKTKKITVPKFAVKLKKTISSIPVPKLIIKMKNYLGSQKVVMDKKIKKLIEPVKKIPIPKPIVKIRNFAYNHTEWCVFLFTLFVGCLSANYFYQRGLITAYVADAIYHLNAARGVVDSLTPGFSQLGTGFLPFIHVSYIPFIWNDFLWYSGLAGTIPTVIYFAITCTFLYKLTSEFWNDKKTGLLAVFIFITIPTVLYFAVVPMFEMPFMMTVILSTYYFYKYLESEKVLYLFISSLFISLSTLTWYVGWILPPFFLSILLTKLITENKGVIILKQKGLKKLLSQRWQKIEGMTLMYILPAFFGICLWLIWNFTFTGNPISFVTGKYSVSPDSITKNIVLDTNYNSIIPIAKFLYAMIHTVGLPILIISLVGLLVVVLKRPDLKTLSLISMIMPATIFIGVIYLFGFGWINVFEIDGAWKNVRYGVTSALFIAFFSVSLIHIKPKIHKIKSILIILLILISGINLIHNLNQNNIKDDNIFMSSDLVVYLKQPEFTGIQTNIKEFKEIGTFLKENYDTGKILLTRFDFEPIILHGRLKIKDIICEYNTDYFEDALETPWNHTRWIIMHKNTNADSKPDYVTLRWNNNHLLLNLYNKVYDKKNIIILKRNNKTLSDIQIYLQEGYFEINNINYFENKLQFNLINYMTLQPEINILLKCEEIPEIEFPLYIENITKYESMVLTMPVMQGCNNLELTVEGKWHNYNKYINTTKWLTDNNLTNPNYGK